MMREAREDDIFWSHSSSIPRGGRTPLRTTVGSKLQYRTALWYVRRLTCAGWVGVKYSVCIDVKKSDVIN